jgi:hypothetical protein
MDDFKEVEEKKTAWNVREWCTLIDSILDL